ncbi:hypothetical protein E2C01_048769 [Portunus trituberculatus]|uniref:Uncharacterized protein n=1 Tax=Portunus trituberculatus TaxID=210409 RepID=A0A5B7G3Y6_PORTR|nr:hypothetical protein [Portunus trituberculatus]
MRVVVMVVVVVVVVVAGVGKCSLISHFTLASLFSSSPSYFPLTLSSSYTYVKLRFVGKDLYLDSLPVATRIFTTYNFFPPRHHSSVLPLEAIILKCTMERKNGPSTRHLIGSLVIEGHGALQLLDSKLI